MENSDTLRSKTDLVLKGKYDAMKENDMEIIKMVEYLYDQLRTVNPNFYYQYVNSTLVNGLSKGDVVSENLSWWKPTVIYIDVVLGLAALAFMGGYIYLDYIKKAKEGE